MITEQTQIISVPNPFSDGEEDVVCVFELYFDSKGVVGEPNLIKAVTNAGCSLIGWLSDERIETIEGSFQEGL